MSKLLTVITVCFNAENSIENTIKSVLSQNTNNFEYLIVDGASTDKTLSIIESYRKCFIEKGVPLKVFSKKDSGVYDAMNRGAMLCKTEWLEYLNAGTIYTNINVLNRVIKEIENSRVDVIYGDYYLISADKSVTQKYLTNDSNLIENMTLGHESCFLKSSVQKKNRYNTKISIAADYDVLLRIKLDGYLFAKINLSIVNYIEDGISSFNKPESYRQVFAVKLKNGIIKDTLINRFIIISGLCVLKEKIYYDYVPKRIIELWEKSKSIKLFYKDMR